MEHKRHKTANKKKWNGFFENINTVKTAVGIFFP